MNSCMDKCNGDSTCTGFSWRLDIDAGVPVDGSTTENGFCYFRSASDATADIDPAAGTWRDYARRLPAGQFVSTISSSIQAPSSSAQAPSSSAAASSTSTSAAAAATATFAAPTTPWSPNVTCSNGGSDPAGGRYTDRFGALWEVRCQNQLDIVSSEDTGTTGQGIYACWKGCNNRPGCSSFVFDGTVGNATSCMCYNPPHFSDIVADNSRSGSDNWVRSMLLQTSGSRQFHLIHHHV
jgi:hypothetical protein